MQARRLIAFGALIVTVAACSSGGSESTGGSSTSVSSSDTVKPALSAIAAEPSAGCDGVAVATTPVEPGEVKITTTSGGVERWYYRHIPPTYSATKPMPVVLDLHGYAEGAGIHLLMSNLGAFGDAHSFVTITPQGSGDKVARWDTGLHSKDMEFIGDLLDEVEHTMCVDERRVYVTGLSNGAFMTSAIACRYADRFAAAAPVAGIRDIKGCKPSRPVPVIAFHGTADGYVDYNGGMGAKAAQLPAPDGSGKTLSEIGAVDPDAKGPTVPEITADWAKRNGCGTKPVETTVAADVTLIKFPCPVNDEVELYRVTGGGHTWPGSEFSKKIASAVGPTTSSISADELMYKFFEAHPLPSR